MLLTPSRIGLMHPCLVIRPPAAFDPGNASRGSILGPRGVALGRISLQNTKIGERPVSREGHECIESRQP